MECALPAEAKLGECPVWSVDEQVLYWVDIDGEAVHRFDPTTGADVSVPIAGRPTALALSEHSGRLLVAVETDIGWLDFAAAEFKPWVQIEEPREGIRLNDGRCDPAGRFWVGGMFVPTSARRFEANLHRFDGDGSFLTVRTEVGCANGLAFSPDGSVMYWADTLHEKVWAYDYDVETGSQSNERVFLDFEPLPGRPDGACVDESGCYWIACVGGSAVLRVTPLGVVDRTVQLPVLRPTMPVFAGPRLDVMYVTTIGRRSPEEEPAGQPGGLYVFDPGVAGMEEPKFAD